SRSCIGREYAEDETEETGWNSFEARMYDPVIGRWMSVDPARQHFSPYLSMGNNPISRVDPDGRVDDDIYHNTKKGETKIVETNRADRLFIDGKFASQYATDGAWKFMSFDNVTMFADHGSYLYDKFGSGLLNDNLYASLMESNSSLDMQMQISNARGRAFMNRAVAIPIVTVSVPILIIGAGEMLGAISLANNTGGFQGAIYQNASRRQLVNLFKGNVRIEKGVEAVPKAIQRVHGVKLSGAIQKPWHVIIRGKELPLNPLNPLWRFFR
ncbi:MAG: RHS repeat domain-containing protein, partial [Cyclobacteriaceae bacterium]